MFWLVVSISIWIQNDPCRSPYRSQLWWLNNIDGINMSSRRRNMLLFTHKMTKIKQTKLTKQTKKQKNISGRGARPHHLKGSIYKHLGRTDGQSELTTSHVFDYCKRLDHQLILYLSREQQLQNLSFLTCRARKACRWQQIFFKRNVDLGQLWPTTKWLL
jgi:hypothetical protein